MSGRSVPTRARLSDERGSVLLLGIAWVGIVLLTLMVGIDASSAFLQRRALVAVADAAALAGAQGIDLDAYYREGASTQTALDPRAVTARVTGFVAQVPASEISGLRLDGVTSDGRSVVVQVSAPVRLPFLSGFVDDRIVVQSRAQLSYRG